MSYVMVDQLICHPILCSYASFGPKHLGFGDIDTCMYDVSNQEGSTLYIAWFESIA